MRRPRVLLAALQPRASGRSSAPAAAPRSGNSRIPSIPLMKNQCVESGVQRGPAKSRGDTKAACRVGFDILEKWLQALGAQRQTPVACRKLARSSAASGRLLRRASCVGHARQVIRGTFEAADHICVHQRAASARAARSAPRSTDSKSGPETITRSRHVGGAQDRRAISRRSSAPRSISGSRPTSSRFHRVARC